MMSRKLLCVLFLSLLLALPAGGADVFLPPIEEPPGGDAPPRSPGHPFPSCRTRRGCGPGFPDIGLPRTDSRSSGRGRRAG